MISSVSRDTIIRAPKRRVRSQRRRGLPCYCLDRCHHHDISVSPMFRPFAGDAELDDYHLDMEPRIDDYQIEIVKSDEQVVRGVSAIRRKTEASSFKRNGHTYYRLKHNDEYQVRMYNNTSEYVNALLKIDSDTMGKWRIAPYSSVMIERPSHNSRKFTFVEEASDEAREGGVRQGSKSGSNGLVEVTFIPMIDRRPDSERWDMPMTNTLSLKSSINSNSSSNTRMAYTNSRGLEAQYAMNSITESNSFNSDADSTNQSYAAGATVLGEDSSQKFGRASRYFVESRDKTRRVTKRVRIVIDNRSRYASIRDRDDETHESGYSDPVPPKAPVRNTLHR